MQGDFSRDSFDPRRHHSAVRLQQGRVVTDADWNEQADIGRHRDATLTRDTVGACGVPLAAAGWRLVAGTQALAVHAVDADTVWVAAEDGALLVTRDGGAAWQLVDLQTAEHLRALHAVGGVGWAVGDRGVVRKTVDGGSTWVAQDAGSRARLRGVFAFDADHAWAVGDGGVALATSDGGASWDAAQAHDGSARLHAVHFVDARVGIAVGQGGAVVASADGGASWVRADSGTRAHLRAVAAFGTTLAWAAGQGGTIVRSSDFGATWQPCPTPTTAALHGIAFRDALEGWAVGQGGVVLHTTDGGASWALLEAVAAAGSGDDAVAATLRAVSVFGDDAPWAVGDGAAALRLASGSPDAFAVELPAVNLSIEPGRCYVGGQPCELEARASWAHQPDGGAGERLAPGTHLLVLNAWQQHLNAIEAPWIREVALGGPDTATRTRAVAQVKAIALPATSPPDWHCSSAVAEWDALVDARRPRLAARAEPQLAAASLCEIAATAGYRRLENQLYRVEIHEGGAAPTFKWSRENASVCFAVVEMTVDAAQSQTIVRVAARGRDANLDLAPHDVVELIDAEAALTRRAGQLFEFLRDGDDENELLLAGVPDGALGQDAALRPLLRRWDHAAPAPVVQALPVVEGVWIDLEDGVQLRFSNPEGGVWRPGDHWQIPARTVTADVEWPRDDDGDPVARPPAGIDDAYCRLGIVEVADDGSVAVVADCRPLFAPLTQTTQLLYAGGDGQDGAPGATLPQPLAVRVARGSMPVAGAVLRFEVAEGGGSVDGAAGWTEVATDADGLASVAWTLGRPAGASWRVQRVVARLLDADGQALPGQQMAFGATASLLLQAVSGDGQQAAAGAALPQPIELRVASSGGEGVAGARLRLTVEQGGGSVDGGGSTAEATTDAEGLVAVGWQIGAGGGPQRLRAELLDDEGQVLQRLAFNADSASGGGTTVVGCDVTIGKNGQFEQLDSELLNRLLKRGEGSACICFLPGVHDLPELEANGGQAGRLSLHGCGAASVVRLGRTVTLVGFAALELRDLVLQPRGDEVGIDLQDNGRLALAGIDFDREGRRAKTPCLSIRGAEQVELRGCTWAADPQTVAAQFDAIAGDCRIAHNRFLGVVGFYGEPIEVDGSAGVIEELRRKLAAGGGRLPGSAEKTPNQLVLHGNHLTQLLVSRAVVEALFGGNDAPTPLFHAASFSGNQVDAANNLFVSRLLAFGASSFTAPIAPGQGSYGLLLAGSASATGNVAVSPQKVPLFVGAKAGAVQTGNALDVQTFAF